jgi:hypothetical protein
MAGPAIGGTRPPILRPGYVAADNVTELHLCQHRLAQSRAASNPWGTWILAAPTSAASAADSATTRTRAGAFAFDAFAQPPSLPTELIHFRSVVAE